jgi:hypothetical protein
MRVGCKTLEKDRAEDAIKASVVSDEGRWRCSTAAACRKPEAGASALWPKWGQRRCMQHPTICPWIVLTKPRFDQHQDDIVRMITLNAVRGAVATVRDFDDLQERANAAVSRVDDGIHSSCFQGATAAMPQCDAQVVTIASVNLRQDGDCSPIRHR